MEKIIDNESRVVEIWLTQDEAASQLISQSLKPIFKHYKQQKYSVVVFSSGKRSLLEQTKQLILNNNRPNTDEAIGIASISQ